ncbi:MAG: hypothetical protein WCJ07_11875 [Verrucomicrobiota bacterium]
MTDTGRHFLDFGRAADFSYCRHYCAKCYFRFVRDFIEPMEKAHGTLPEGGFPSGIWWHEIMEFPGVNGHLAKELEYLPLADFLKLQHWDGHLCVAFAMLKDSELQAGILRRWLENCPDNARFIDVVIFYLLPHAFVPGDLHEKWVAKAVNMALAKRDYSLVESLVWRLGGGLDKYPELLKLATELQKTSSAIAKAMNSRIVSL